MTTDYGATTVCPPADLEKDPDSTISVRFDWASDLDGDTISTSDYVLPDGLTEGAESGTGSYRTVKVSGGTCGNVYRVTNRITTAAGLTLDKTRRVLVRSQ